MKIFLFILLVISLTLMVFQNIHVNSFASPLLVLYLFIIHPCFLFESLSDLLIMFSEQMNLF